MQTPFSVLTRIFCNDEDCLSVIAVMINGVETYRFLHQPIVHGQPFGVVYETTFTDSQASKDFFDQYKAELLF
jgi:hypothetical protein